jgi:fatty acid desaturase
MTQTTDPTALSASAAAARGDFADLTRLVRAAGLMGPRPRYYAVKIPLNLLFLAGAWAAVVWVGDSWWQLAVAGLLAFVYTQTGFVGHDIGHRQVTGNRRAMDVLGRLHGNLLMGFSYGWWVNHHNKHHSHPNHLEKDSDITRRRVIFVPEQGHTREGRVKQFIVRHQHKLFYGLLTTESLGLRVASLKAVREKAFRGYRLEGTLIVVHLVAYFAAVFLIMSPGVAVLFILCHQALFGLYLGLVFAPNHKGMPIQREDEDWDWMTRQIRTSRNIRSSYLTDFLYGGLNYQIEHHLYPTMPRRNLRHVRPIVRAYCEKHGITYYETGAWRSYVEIFQHLYRTTSAYQASLERGQS